MRRLTLRSEHLADLTPDDLAAVNGGAPPTLKTCERPTIDRCLTGYYPSINAPCETLLTVTTGTN